MPSAFTVSNTPVTGSGTLTVTAAGTASQYVRGDGQLADFPQGGGGGGASVNYYLNGSVNQGTFGGSTYYEMNKNAIIGSGTNFTINADGYIASFLTDANDPNLLLIPAGNWNFELKFSASSGGGTPSFYLELYKYDGTTFTLIATSSSSPEIITGGTSIDTYYTPLAVPETVLLATDRLAIRIYVTHQSRTITLYTENNSLAEVITTFTTGLNALNGLTKQVQYFATGTSGTDFNISSSTDTHTFNFPTASATNRGLLSTTDWSTFNSKENVLTFSSPLVRSTNTISIPAATTSVNGYLTSTNFTTFNNKQNAITLTTTGSSGPATFVSNTLNIPNYISINDGIESGGVVSYSGTGLVFNVSACVYYINGIRYTTSATTITLTTADATNPRIDVIAVNTSSAVVLITGTPSANPVEPQVDPATQIQLTNITVNAGSTTPSIPSELVYDENVETWTKANSGFLSVNYANTVAPYTGTLSTLVVKGTSSGGGSLTFTSPSILNLTDYSVLKFAIKLNRALISSEYIYIGIFNSATLLSNYIFLYGPYYNQPLYGFDYSSTSWQLISVNLSSIGATSGNFNRLGIFGFFNVVDDIEIGYDRIEFQNINNQLPTSGISIGDKINNATTGSVLFTGANGILQQNNTNFYWDDTNNRLGLGNNTPSFTLDVSGTGRVTGNLTASSLIKSGGTASQILAADGSVITAGTNITISGGTISANDTDTGITSLNGLTALSQTFATGSSGTDFNISSATSTHTFNIPTASATNRGALSSTDWTTFNNKQNTITNPVTGTGTTNELSYWTSSSAIGSLTTATYPSLTELSYVKGVTSAIQTQLNGKQGTLTLTTTGTSGAATLIGNTLNIPQYGGGGMAIGGSITSATAGSVLFAGTSGVLQQDNANFFWDDTNNRLGIGTSTPQNIVDIQANTNASAIIKLTNTSTGTGARNIITVGDFTGNAYGYLGYNNSGYTASGIIRASSTLLLHATENTSLTIAAINNGGFIDFVTASTALANIRARITAAGRFLIGTTTESTYLLDVNGQARSTQYNISALNTAPATASSTGTLGEIRITADYIYICTATNTWKRVAIATW
jgi:hypothetical protein